MSTGRLPDTFIVGEMKCGTTALANYLSGHPDVFVVPGKEVHFFNRDEVWARGRDWYAELFAGAAGERRLVDGSPSTLFYGHAVERLAATVPEARIVAILRHPAERAWSHYWHEQFLGTQLGTFDDVVERELAEPREPHVIARGRYLKSIDRLLEHFPRERVHVIVLDDLEAHPESTWKALCRFLDIDPAYEPPNLTMPVNPATEHRARWLFVGLYRFRLWRWMPRRVAVWLHHALTRPADRQALGGATRERLVETYREDNAALGRWLGCDLSAWDV